MEQTTTSTSPPGAETTTPVLVRPRQGRVIAGVAQGIANRWSITPWVVRALFVLTSIAGGLGLALYVAGWALIRNDDETESPAQEFFANAREPRSWIGIGLIFLAALLLLDNLTFLSGGVVWAVALLAVGVLLYMGQISVPARASNDADTESKEGVQQMTTTATGVSPAGTTTPPPPPAPPKRVPTPPVLPPQATPPKERSILGRLTIGMVLVGLGVLAILDNMTILPGEPVVRHYLALSVTIIGVGLLVGSLWGRARWLILVGVLLVPTLFISPILEGEWTTESFDINSAPTEFSELGDYTLDVGNLVIDLRELPWNGESIDLTARVDAGNLVIYLPEGVGLTGQASVDVGRVGAPGVESSGLGTSAIDFDQRDYPSDLGVVDLDAIVDVGNIQIWIGR